MAKSLNLILQSLKESNFLKGVCVVSNGKTRCEFSLLQNGLKLRELLLQQLLSKSTKWSTQCGDIRVIDNSIGHNNQISFLQKIEFQNEHQKVFNEKLVTMTNSVAWKIMYNKINSNFVCEDSLFYGSTANTVLVTDFFVAAENDLFRYNNLQRDRKVWWMNFSANPSRYWLEPCQINFANEQGEIGKNTKSMSIKAKYTYGSTEVENIHLIPLHKSAGFSGFGGISLIRSVINLDLAVSALILDSSVFRSNTEYFSLMLNRKLAPYQVLLAKLRDQNTTVDDLTKHLQHVISRSGLRLYDNFVHSDYQMDLEKKLSEFDAVGIPYILVIDDESTKSGLMRIRNRDTTLFETIHISDIPNYLLNLFAH